MPDPAKTSAPNPYATSAANAAAQRHVRGAIVLEADGRGIWPMAVRRVWPGLKALQAPCHPTYDVNGGPMAPDDTAGVLIPGLLSTSGLPHQSPGIILAQAVIAEGPVWDALRSAAASGIIGLTVVAEWERALLERSAAVSAAAYFETFMSGGQRKRLRQKRRALEDMHGPLRLDVALDAVSVMSAMSAFCDLEAVGWKGREGTALVRHPADLAYVTDVMAGMAEAGDAFVVVMRGGEHVLAAGLFLRCGGEAVFWKTAYDEALSRHSPGVVFDVMLTEWLYDQPWFERLDTGSDDSVDPDTLIWKQRRRMADVVIALDPGSLRGRAVVAGQRLRRWLRSLKHRFARR
jgi:Acetyltransferase (GNAT) domain